MTNSAPTLHEAAASLYRGCGQFPFRFARGKLKRDPIMLDLLMLGCLSRKDASAARLLDLGCGQGLLFATLEASAHIARDSKFASTSPPALSIAYAQGFDAAPSNVRWGQSMLARRIQPQLAAEIVAADIRTVDLPVCDIVVAIDVLHYLPYVDQERLLRKIAQALTPGGRLLLRVGDAAHARASRVSGWIDRAMAAARGQGRPALWQRPLPDWKMLLQRSGFAATAVKTYRSWWAVNVLVRGDKLN
jgi:SAM-dependent methyltransferase